MNNAPDNKAVWIKTGYELFAYAGEEALKIEPLARKVGKSKSSFYHHFADLELFMEVLLAYHLEQSTVIAHKEIQATRIDPDIIHVFIEHKTDLLFNRQLRIHKNIPAFAAAVYQSDKMVGNSFVHLWLRDTGMEMPQQQLEAIFALALENFYLQINPANLNYPWLSAYFSSLKEMLRKFN
ncbi:MAG: TetR/AcrR family transcriptional regulator [Bacteroidetes bacterium]|nr:TetR/AcrR family transcriptional regulator [Bacteroidota bacterium]